MTLYGSVEYSRKLFKHQKPEPKALFVYDFELSCGKKIVSTEFSGVEMKSCQ